MANQKNKRRKNSKRLPLAAAVQRVDWMAEVIETEVRSAICVETALEGANKIVASGELTSKSVAGAECYNIVKHSLTSALAMSLSKLFDLPQPRKGESKASCYNRSDIVSIPLLVRLLRQRRVQDALCDRAREWLPSAMGGGDSSAQDCLREVHQAIEAFDRLNAPDTHVVDMAQLREFRHRYLAHLLLKDALEILPRYADLFRLMDVAQDVMTHARLAITGVNIDLREFEEFRAEEAEKFWRPALHGAHKAGEEEFGDQFF